MPHYHRIIHKVLLAGLAVIGMSIQTCPAAIQVANDVFVGGAEGPQGTSNYRIPGMTTAADGSILAFAEGRRSGADPGQGGALIDLVMKRSVDGGRNWSRLQVLDASDEFDFDDPTPVVDQTTGDVHLLYGRIPDACGLFCVPPGTGSDSMNVFHMRSFDNGQSWSLPHNITTEIKDPTWRGIVPGPGSGIQLRWQTDPSRNDRLVIPASVNANSNFVFFSDDAGQNWQSGSLAQDDLGLSGFDGNENEVVELTNGDLLLNARQSGGSHRRMFLSQNGGATWSDSFSGDVDITRVDGSMIRYSAERDGQDRDRILFSGPSGTPPGSGSGRSNITVWTSYDEGQSFINPVVIESGFGAYSVLTKLQDDSVGLLYEATGSTQIRYLNFNTPHLEGDYHPDSLTQFDGWANQVDAFQGGVGWSGRWSDNNVNMVGGGLEFTQFKVSNDEQHAQFRGGDMTRNLATPLDLDTNATYYISLFVRQDDDGANGGSEEWLDVRLRNGNDQQFAFGVDSSEAFFVRNENTASNVLTSGGALSTNTDYLLLAKIEARDNSPGNFDQIFLSLVDDPALVPTDEGDITWVLAGETGDNFSGVIDSIFVGGGQNADWNVDALRIADSFAGAIVDNGLTGVAGDINQDGVLNLMDRDAFVLNWRSSGHDTLFDMITHGDFTQDGITSLPDVFVLHQAFQDAGFDIPIGDLLIPEPASMLGMAWGLLLLARRR